MNNNFKDDYIEGYGYYGIGFGNLDPIDFAILYDVIEFYARAYGLNATEAVKYYEKCKYERNRNDAYGWE